MQFCRSSFYSASSNERNFTEAKQSYFPRSLFNILPTQCYFTKRFENVVKMDQNDDNISGDVSTKKMSLVKLLL